MNHTKYDKLAQMQAHKAEYKTDWPLIICSISVCVFGVWLLDSIALEINNWFGIN